MSIDTIITIIWQALGLSLVALLFTAVFYGTLWLSRGRENYRKMMQILRQWRDWEVHIHL